MLGNTYILIMTGVITMGTPVVPGRETGREGN